MPMPSFKYFILSIIFTLLIWGSAWISIPIGPVPITMQTVVILLCALLLPLSYALFSVILYILLGLIGLPVFAGGRSGIEVLSGPTAGFIFGFIVTVLLVSILTKDIRYNVKGEKTLSLYWRAFWPCIIGSGILQLCGILWGKIYTGAPWGEIYDVWLEPFYLNMITKIIISVLISVNIWKIASKE